MTRVTCYHQKKHIVWTTVGNDGTPLAGPRQLRHQCGECGRLLPSALPHSMANRNTPDLDFDALTRWIKHDREQWGQHRLNSDELARQRDLEWRAKYDAYLQSHDWTLKRLKVFKRSGGMCEGCGDNKATQVHHLTYDHLGDELLWELKAVCRACHEKVHQPRKFMVVEFPGDARRRA